MHRVYVILFGIASYWLLSQNILADDDGWGISGGSARIPAADLKRIGLAICGQGKYRIDDDAVTCRICPDYTGNAGDVSDMTISARHIGHFSSARGPSEWLLDTDGCEPHYADFGGAILLADHQSKTAAEGLELLFYQPGYRVGDCLIWPTRDSPSMLVCNEVSTAQGESVGHISMMDMDRRGISRWRLFRWFDNSGSIQSDIVSITPHSMTRVTLNNGQPALRIEMRKLIISREAFDKEPEPTGQPVTLDFQLRGRRFFATEATQRVIEELSVLIRRMLE